MLHPPPGQLLAAPVHLHHWLCGTPACCQVGTYRLQWGGVSGGIELGDADMVYRCRQEVCVCVCVLASLVPPCSCLAAAARLPACPWNSATAAAGPQSCLGLLLKSLRASSLCACLPCAQLVEEVGLTKEVALVRSGRPLYVDDGRLHFAVHPFLFQLTDADAQVRPSCLLLLPLLPL